MLVWDTVMQMYYYYYLPLQAYIKIYQGEELPHPKSMLQVSSPDDHVVTLEGFVFHVV